MTPRQDKQAMALLAASAMLSLPSMFSFGTQNIATGQFNYSEIYKARKRNNRNKAQIYRRRG